MSATIDTETFASDATRAHTENCQVLLDGLGALRDEIQETVESMTKPEIGEAVGAEGHSWESSLTGRETKAELVEKLTGIRVRKTETAEKIRALNEAQNADEEMVRLVNATVESMDAELASFSAKVATVNGFNHELRWSASSLADLTATYAYLEPFVATVNNGHDIRKVTQHQAENALRVLVRAPSAILQGDRPGAGGSEELQRARGAQNFLGMVGRAYGDSSMAFSAAVLYI